MHFYRTSWTGNGFVKMILPMQAYKKTRETSLLRVEFEVRSQCPSGRQCPLHTARPLWLPQSAFTSALKKEAECPFKTSVKVYKTTQHHMPEKSDLHNSALWETQISHRFNLVSSAEGLTNVCTNPSKCVVFRTLLCSREGCLYILHINHIWHSWEVQLSTSFIWVGRVGGDEGARWSNWMFFYQKVNSFHVRS
jgi:hypothetical protein